MIRSLSGQEYRENRHLLMRLATLRADYNQLKQDTDELLKYADNEISQLKHENAGLTQTLDELQLRVWELEQQVNDLLDYIAQLDKSDLETDGDQLPDNVQKPDLSTWSLGIIGGHATTRRGVIEVLSNQYGLGTWVEIPPLSENSIKRNVLRGKIRRCALIFIITGYMSHSLTHAVYSLKASGALAGEVVLLNCRGTSGVVREVLDHVIKKSEEML
ncbi:hypothetical protein IQ260_26265 [Leptolyngbya cf. ectocarpi LEGE 11479]|uniref:DUF2325 domain-containing protein n=1 Tax=Leptolyngbya cf. ectocarpi LEGE 11479 TaxID=1828722 RepID=A0A928ZZ84_LEPEC|nr:hypothetical protein [Leptolyngbya ectocarpi]MBE9070151.1 hypothetical protein [Leptolyngbya cf. ectocarpi LEGE 11479]